MKKFDIKIKPMGSQAVLIEWPHRISEDILQDILNFTQSVLEVEKPKLRNYLPAYNSLLLYYDAVIDISAKKELFLSIHNSLATMEKISGKVWHIPVCYDEQFGIDTHLFQDHGITAEELIRLHTKEPFRVFMIGFLPGFLYLGGLPQSIHMARKAIPRQKVLKGAVAIGGEQTGIYPVESPGGWQVIGRTPLTLFDLHLETPTPIQQGDLIQFYSIDLKTYEIFSSHQN